MFISNIFPLFAGMLLCGLPRPIRARCEQSTRWKSGVWWIIKQRSWDSDSKCPFSNSIPSATSWPFPAATDQQRSLFMVLHYRSKPYKNDCCATFFSIQSLAPRLVGYIKGGSRFRSPIALSCFHKLINMRTLFITVSPTLSILWFSADRNVLHLFSKKVCSLPVLPSVRLPDGWASATCRGRSRWCDFT